MENVRGGGGSGSGRGERISSRKDVGGQCRGEESVFDSHG